MHRVPRKLDLNLPCYTHNTFVTAIASITRAIVSTDRIIESLPLVFLVNSVESAVLEGEPCVFDVREPCRNKHDTD